METTTHPGATVFVIFGAGGDLTSRKLIPALYNLFLDKWLPQQFKVVGLDRAPMSDDKFAQHLRQGVDKFSRRGKAEDQSWHDFASHLTYASGDLTNPKTYNDLSKRLIAQDAGKPCFLPGGATADGGTDQPGPGQGPAQSRALAGAHRRRKTFRQGLGFGQGSKPDAHCDFP